MSSSSFSLVRSRALPLAGVLALVAGCQCGIKPVPDVASSDFQMDRDSLSFPNFVSGFDDSVLDTKGMQRMFGDAVCSEGVSPCQLTRPARAFVDKANESMAGGRCEGFAVLSDLMAAKKIDVTSFGAPTARQLTLEGNTALQRELAYWFSTQLVPGAVAEKTKGYEAKEVLSVLTDSFVPNATEHYRIGIVRKNGKSISGGHSLTPLGHYADKTKKGVYWLRVYDNNNPDVERLIKLDVIKNRWEFNAQSDPSKPPRLYFGDSANHNLLYLAPVFSRQGVLPCPFCKGSGAVVQTTGGAQATVKTPGGTAGVSDGEVTVGSGASVTPTFSNFDQEPSAWLIGLSASLMSGMNEVEVTLSNPGDLFNPDSSQSVGFSNSEVTTVASRMVVTAIDTFTASNTGSTYLNASRTPMQLATQVLTSMGTVTLTAFVSAGSDSLSTHVDPSGALSIELQGANGATVYVTVRATTSGGQNRSAQFVITAAGPLRFDAQISSWMAGGNLSATLRNGGVTQTLSDACTDRVKSGQETDVDCGAVCNVGCLVGQGCGVDADCGSGLCHPTMKTCISDACIDTRQSAGETGVDCGGPSCAPCALGGGCQVERDCVDPSQNSCVSGACRRVFRVAVALNVAAAIALFPGSEVVLANGTDELSLLASGTFTFPTRTAGLYAVTVSRQPVEGECTVSNGSGTATADVTINVSCVRRFVIGGSVSGLPSSDTVTLENNGASPLVISNDGAFIFPVQPPGAYAVTISAQPANAVCTVSNATGGAPTVDIDTIRVDCIATATDAGVDAGMAGPQGRDLTFGTGGLLRLATDGGSWANQDQWTSVVRNPDDTYVLAGSSEVVAGSTQWVVSKVTSAGAVDTSFGTGGHLFITANAGAEAATRVLRDASGRYLVAGSLRGTANLDLAVVRLTSGGAIDTTFATNGIAQFDFGGDELVDDLAIDSLGRLVLVGLKGSPFAGDMFVARLTSAGALDPSFGVNGRYLPITAQADGLHALVIAPGDAVIAVGFNGPDSAVLKLTSAGAPDMTFATQGLFTYDVTTGLYDDFLSAVALDGTRIVAVGLGRDSGASNYTLVGLTAAGALDTSFGVGGASTFGGALEAEGFRALAPRPGGGWYAAGFSSPTFGALPRAALMRFTAAGTRDATFGTGGEFIDAYGGSADAFALTLDALGRAVIAGAFSNPVDPSDPGIARINP